MRGRGREAERGDWRPEGRAWPMKKEWDLGQMPASDWRKGQRFV